MSKASKRQDPIGVSLFTGAGGLDIGMERAGFSPAYVCDNDPVCVETLASNQRAKFRVAKGAVRSFLESARIEHEDVCSLGGEEFRRVHGRRVDCVYGGPPCQSFSSSGKMGSILDPRGLLIFEFCRFVEECRPRTFVLENVRGLITARCRAGAPGGVLRQLVERLEATGYGVNVALLNAADYGAYQRRIRCFIVGVDSGEPPAFPPPTHAKTGDEGTLFGGAIENWRTLREFLDEWADEDELHWTRPTLALARDLRFVPNGSGLKSAGVVETTRPGGHWGYRQGTFIADLDLPARTVTGSSSQDWIRLEDGSLRRLTFREVARLQGFPNEWVFAGTKAAQFKQVGNAVPAQLGEVVGRMVGDYLSTYRPKLRVRSRPIPTKILSAVEYTRREECRNGASRRRRIPARSK